MGDTIFAQATPPGRAGVAIVRISGPRALAAGEALAGTPVPARVASLRWLRDPGTRERIDQALVLAFPGPRSFSGEDVVELHLHGSTAVSRAVLASLGALDGLRMAEPGEFSRRALMNGRMDLSQVEGLGDLLVAETAIQRQQALRVMDGAVSRLAQDWRERLVHALAFVEASIDFADEELPADVLEEVRAIVAATIAAMQQEIAAGRVAERIRDGFEVAIVGRPNVGKSTLLNSLARRDVALTSKVAGTTRDVIEVRMDLGGIAMTLLDMAGLRERAGRVEALGVARARQRAAAADLRIFLVADADEVDLLGVVRRDGDIVVRAKADLRGDVADGVSGTTGQGVDALLATIADALSERVAGAGTAAELRQRLAIGDSAACLDRALASLPQRVEVAAEELRGSLRALDFLVGKVDVESVLDVVFRSFCLGK